MNSKTWLQKLADNLADGTPKLIILTDTECRALHEALVIGTEAQRHRGSSSSKAHTSTRYRPRTRIHFYGEGGIQMTRNNRRITLCPDCHTRFYPALKQRQDLAQTMSTGICSHCLRKWTVRSYVVEDPEAMPFPEVRLISGKELAQILEKGKPK